MCYMPIYYMRFEIQLLIHYLSYYLSLYRTGSAEVDIHQHITSIIMSKISLLVITYYINSCITYNYIGKIKDTGALQNCLFAAVFKRLVVCTQRHKAVEIYFFCNTLVGINTFWRAYTSDPLKWTQYYCSCYSIWILFQYSLSVLSTAHRLVYISIISNATIEVLLCDGM